MKVNVGGETFNLFRMKNGALYYKKPYKTASGKTGTRPRIVAGSSETYMKQIRRRSVSVRKRRSSRKSKDEKRKSHDQKKASAMRAFIRHYSKSRYETDKGRKIAITRDLRQDNQIPTRSLSKYRSNPAKYDMVGVDMGEYENLATLSKVEKKLSSTK